MNTQRMHNKSQSVNLSVGNMTEYEYNEALHALKNAFVGSTRVEGLVVDSPCWLLPAADGRISVRQKKVAFGYQLVACLKFGRDVVGEIDASKHQDSTVISHLCGTRNCIHPKHLVLETKRINDERTHCHFCLSKATDRELFYLSGACHHFPKCGTETIESI